jgi:fibronectin-binding autotransporter adhesin
LRGGTLLLRNRRPSPKGSGVVQVNSGTLGGTGLIAGDVVIGTGSGSGAFPSPGVFADSHRTLRLLRTLTFNSGGTYNFGMNSNAGGADKVIANGVTINNGAEFSFEDSHSSALPPDTVFTVIDNTAATPIAGAFGNLVDGATFTVGSNTFQVSYEGGDGNDLTLTVL